MALSALQAVGISSSGCRFRLPAHSLESSFAAAPEFARRMREIASGDERREENPTEREEEMKT